MNEPDNSSQTTETACAPPQPVHTIAPEQLRRWLTDRRSRLKQERVALLAVADRLKKEIAAYDQLLAELTTR